MIEKEVGAPLSGMQRTPEVAVVRGMAHSGSECK